MKTIVTFDVETTIFQKGNPYSNKNKIVVAGFKVNDEPPVLIWADDFEFVAKCKHFFDIADLIVGFNLKFDLAWGERCGFYQPYYFSGKFWDSQLCDFIRFRQRTPYPSLNDVAAKYSLGSKLDNIDSEYWSKGIDTDSIPRETLGVYLEQDLNLNYAVYLAQDKDLPDSMRILVSLSNQDLPFLQQMESNGLILSTDTIEEENKLLKDKIVTIEKELSELFGVKSEVNFNSHEHLSVLLYGGELEYKQKIAIGTYKTGQKAGQTRYKGVVYTVPYPRLVEPPKGSELAKEGVYSTDVEALQQIKGNKQIKNIIQLLLKRSELVKLSNTYLEGWMELNKEMDWNQGVIHGQFNQCVAVTGRLSSSRPNLQNAPKEMKKFIVTRFDDHDCKHGDCCKEG